MFVIGVDFIIFLHFVIFSSKTLSSLSCVPFSIHVFYYRMFHSAELVHGNMNEYNILVVPKYFFGDIPSDISSSKELDEQQIVLVDFSQTVDRRHPDAIDLMRRDLGAIRHFFVKQGVRTPTVEDTLQFIIASNSGPVSSHFKVDEPSPR